MAFKIVWTKQAIHGFDKIVNYLIENWTNKEVINFIKETDDFFEILMQYPDILQRTASRENVHRGPINRYTIVIYRVKPSKNLIEVITIRSTRQKPLKKYYSF